MICVVDFYSLNLSGAVCCVASLILVFPFVAVSVDVDSSVHIFSKLSRKEW